MKKYLIAFLTITALLILSEPAYPQSEIDKPGQGYWVLVSNIHDKKNTTIQYYLNNSNLIYEEKMVNRRFNIKRKKNLKILKEGMGEALIAWNVDHQLTRNGNLVALMKHRKL